MKFLKNAVIVVFLTIAVFFTYQSVSKDVSAQDYNVVTMRITGTNGSTTFTSRANSEDTHTYSGVYSTHSDFSLYFSGATWSSRYSIINMASGEIISSGIQLTKGTHTFNTTYDFDVRYVFAVDVLIYQNIYSSFHFPDIIRWAEPSTSYSITTTKDGVSTTSNVGRVNGAITFDDIDTLKFNRNILSTNEGYTTKEFLDFTCKNAYVLDYYGNQVTVVTLVRMPFFMLD